ncbi:hypothetical protein MTO96_022325 [Rhipicephalus appendiculatus]
MKRQLHRRQGGCCRRLLRLREENARFVLLAVVLLVYMILGALLFRAIEGPWETEARERYDQVLRDFWLKYNGTVDPEDVVKLLEEHGNASSRNLLPNKRPRWDFVGSFYFVGTVVSTIDGLEALSMQSRRGELHFELWATLERALGLEPAWFLWGDVARIRIPISLENDIENKFRRGKRR